MFGIYRRFDRVRWVIIFIYGLVDSGNDSKGTSLVSERCVPFAKISYLSPEATVKDLSIMCSWTLRAFFYDTILMHFSDLPQKKVSDLCSCVCLFERHKTCQGMLCFPPRE